MSRPAGPPVAHPAGDGNRGYRLEPQVGQAPEPEIVDVARPKRPKLRLAALRRAAAASGRSVFALLAEWARLRLAAGLELDEYLGLRLFDDALYGGADKRRFAGISAARKILMRANYRIDLYGLIDHKIACDFLLAAHGIPVLPTVALYHQSTGREETPFLLRSGEELGQFLRRTTSYPLFAKPLGGMQSLGSASFDRYDATRDALVAFDGSAIGIDPFVATVQRHYPAGYLLQKRMEPHAALHALCGDRLPTVRMLTAHGARGASVLRACWKIPAGGNAADNFWRAGNLLAQLDLDSGRVLRVLRSRADGFDEVTHHPDSGVALDGLAVPDWPDLLRLARDGATVFAEIPLLGWDIAPSASGAVVVEVNQMPDFKLHQLADRRGILDDAMRDFLRDCDADAARFRRRLRGR